MKIVRDRLVSPRDRALEWIHDRHMHDGPNVREVALSYSKIERTEGLGGHNSGSILQISKPVLQHMVHLGNSLFQRKLIQVNLRAKSKVVDKDYSGRRNSWPMFWAEEVALEQLVWGIFLAIP